jgi:PAS domain S-box-containing protein
VTLPIALTRFSDFDGILLEANAPARRLFELEDSDVPGYPLSRLQRLTEEWRAVARRRLDAGEAVVLTRHQTTTAKGRPVWVDAHMTAVFEGGRRVAFEVYAIDVTRAVEVERSRRSVLEDQVEAQRQLLRQIVDDQEDLVYRAKADGTLTFANRAYGAHVGVSEIELPGRNVFELVPAEFHGPFRDRIAALTPERPTIRVPPVVTRHDRVLDWTIRGFFDASGRLEQLQCTAHDITALQSALEQREVLLREVHHRVKNNLQVISSLLALQFEGFEDPAIREGIAKTEARIRTLSLAHEALHHSADVARVDTTTYVETLLDTLREAFGARDRHVKLEQNVAQVPMDLDTAMRCGSIINELVSNALRYAFDEHGGTVRVELARRGGDNVLIVSDDGRGLPESALIPPVKTLGLELVRQLCAHLDARMTVDREHGTRFEIVFPPPRVAD